MRQELLKAENATKAAAASGGAFVGIFARFSSSMGVGYIDCAELQRQFGSREVQIAREHYMGLDVGDTVVFKVVINGSGEPQAAFAKRVGELTRQRQEILEVRAPLPAPGTAESSQEFLGFVTSFQADPGLGFISCAQTRQLYGHDVLLHRDQYADLGIGDAVRFRVALNPQGTPVARGVRRAVDGATGGQSGPGRPGAKVQRSRSRSMSQSMSISRSAQRMDASSAKPGAAAGGGSSKKRSSSGSRSVRRSSRRRRSPSSESGRSRSDRRSSGKSRGRDRRRRSSSRGRRKRRSRSSRSSR